MKELTIIFRSFIEELKALEFALSLISWDSATISPAGCFETRCHYIETLSKRKVEILTSKEFKETVFLLLDKTNNESGKHSILNSELLEIKKTIDRMDKLPHGFYAEYMGLIAKSNSIWEKARLSNDYTLFEKELQIIVDYTRKYAKYIGRHKSTLYDALLNIYEPGFTQKKYDKFFQLIKEKLIPLITQIQNKKTDTELASKNQFLGEFPIEKQKMFVQYISKVMNFDLDYGVIGESIHPFTLALSQSDVRVTINYDKNNFTSSIFTSLHELGHALYEKQIDSDLDNTFLSTGSSMALHESQSRLYENIIGRNYDFWKVHYKNLQKTFSKELKHVPLKNFYRFINDVKAQSIRVDADELTYPLHIIIRYEIERDLINGIIDVKDVKTRWKELYKEYLGIEVASDEEGAFQDSHWSLGLFGYFPTYALGSAYASQIYNKMKKDINVRESLKKGTTIEINEWLRKNIHCYGATKSPKEILLLSTKKSFNPNYYIKYLTEKYKKLYNL